MKRAYDDIDYNMDEKSWVKNIKEKNEVAPQSDDDAILKELLAISKKRTSLESHCWMKFAKRVLFKLNMGQGKQGQQRGGMQLCYKGLVIL
jgi:hypothetical protein